MKVIDLFAYGNGWGDELWRGFIVTMKLSIFGYVIGTTLGLIAALGLLSGRRLVSQFISGWATVMRSVPELLIIFLFYFGGGLFIEALAAPFGVTRVDVDAFGAGLAAIALIHAAYASEVFRGAINAV